MKIYKKEIRPMIEPFWDQGYTPQPYPAIDKWFAEEKKEELEKIYNKKIKNKEFEGGWCKLFFDERYIEVNA